jgi:transposase
MERQKARSPKGRKAFSQRSCYKGQKYTVIGAISINGVVCLRTIKGSMKGEDFVKFVKEDLCPNLDSSNGVVMDNLRAHKMDDVESAIRATGAKIIYLSSYSPDFNPIEMLWSVLKAFVRTFSPKTLAGIQLVLKIFVLILDKSFFRNWFAKCCYCIP